MAPVLGRVTLDAAIAELEQRYGVTSVELEDWLKPSRCGAIPVWEVHRWVALLAVRDKENE